MFVVMNRIPVNKEFQEDFEARFKKRQGLVDQSPGFIRNMVLRPYDESSEYHIVLTIWESRNAFTAWTQSESFVRAHEKARETPKDMFRGGNVLEMFEVISDSDETPKNPTTMD